MFQYVGVSPSHRAHAESRGNRAAEQAAELLDRYPNVSETELALLINVYRQLSALDVALMISDETVGPKLDRFSKDQRTKIRTPLRQYAVLVAFAVLGIAVVALAMAIHS
jgi:hypothetical protein